MGPRPLLLLVAGVVSYLCGPADLEQVEPVGVPVVDDVGQFPPLLLPAARHGDRPGYCLCPAVRPSVPLDKKFPVTVSPQKRSGVLVRSRCAPCLSAHRPTDRPTCCLVCFCCALPVPQRRALPMHSLDACVRVCVCTRTAVNRLSSGNVPLIHDAASVALRQRVC